MADDKSTTPPPNVPISAKFPWWLKIIFLFLSGVFVMFLTFAIQWASGWLGIAGFIIWLLIGINFKLSGKGWSI
jgi:hypothetical protein